MGPRLPAILKDAGLTTLWPPHWGHLHRRLPHRRRRLAHGRASTTRFVDLAVALVVIFVGRVGLSLAVSRVALADHWARRRHDGDRRVAAQASVGGSCIGSWSWAACCW